MGASRSALVWPAALLCAALYFVLSQAAASGKSAAYDEPVHLLSGFRILTEGDHGFNHEHPPLMKALAAAPIVATGAATALEPWRYTREFDEWPLSHNWLYHANDGDRLLRLARAPIALAGALLVLLVFAAARCASGGDATAALAAAGLAALEPNLLAHGSLVTTDMGMALFHFAAAVSFWRYLETRSRGWLALSGLIWGLGLLAKFSAVLLGPAFLAMGIAHALASRRRRARAGESPAPGRKRRAKRTGGGGAPAPEETEGPRSFWRRLFVAPPPWERGAPDAVRSVLLPVVAAGIVALVVLNAGYGFDGSLTSLSAMKLESDGFKRWAGGALGALPIPAPAAFVAGFDHAEAGGQRWWSYLMGEHSMTGWSYYYLVALAVKTSIPLLLLALAGALLAPRAGIVTLTRLVLLCLPPALLLASFTFSSNLKNIGLRYVLAVHPFLCLLGGLGAAALLRRGGKLAPAAAALLIVWVGVAEARIYPDHLAYFNEAAGGPEGGRWWLLDSNLDWGQDLKGLGRWMKARGMDEIYLDYFGRACPAYYGIRAKAEFTGGWLAVSATNLEGVYGKDKRRYDFLRGVRPEAVIGHSILVYDTPLPAGTAPLRGDAPR